MRKELYTQAIDSYKKALSLDSGLKKAYFNIAGAYHFKKDIKNAIKYWEKTIEYDKQNYSAYINLALCSINDLNDDVKALRYIRSAYEINKFVFDVVFNYGLIFLKTGDNYRAQEKFEEAIKLDDKNYIAYVALAECKVKQNKAQEAFELLESIKEFKSNDKDYLIVRALTLKALMYQKSENVEIIDEINQICDKIQLEYGDSAMAEELRQQN